MSFKVWQVAFTPKELTDGYVSIHDKGDGHIRRNLFIRDDEGNTVCIKDEQIGELYKAIKPALAG